MSKYSTEFMTGILEGCAWDYPKVMKGQTFTGWFKYRIVCTAEKIIAWIYFPFPISILQAC